ncbi:MAG: LysR family transcriptional regulator, partial [Oscillospiraceae bacterium]|nr:LysR family transcriptional regulator [Oscillospiraceae bacterium]
MIELEQLQQLIAVSEAGTISAAADSLHLSQPALTRSLQRLEAELGVSLFHRKRNRVALNDVGELALA